VQGDRLGIHCSFLLIALLTCAECVNCHLPLTARQARAQKPT
jgi:hypothetical protein